MTTIAETTVKQATQMDTSRRCASVPARLGREFEAETQPCVTENSSPALLAPSQTAHKTFIWNLTALSTPVTCHS